MSIFLNQNNSVAARRQFSKHGAGETLYSTAIDNTLLHGSFRVIIFLPMPVVIIYLSDLVSTLVLLVVALLVAAERA
jgi:hypothetical protein